MSTSLVPAKRAALVPRTTSAALSVSAQIQQLQPSRVLGTFLNGESKTIWYFEKPADPVTRNRTCAYISHARGGATFTMAYHPLDRNDQVVQNLPMDRLGAAIEDLLAAGFGSRPAQQPLSHGLKAQTSHEQQPLKLTGAAPQAAGTTTLALR